MTRKGWIVTAVVLLILIGGVVLGIRVFAGAYQAAHVIRMAVRFPIHR
jgi:hypothetical protein